MTIQIPTPCAQRWVDMTAVRPDCRYCAACERQIVDFTTKTDAEILAHLNRNDGKACGRFRPDQLGRPLSASRPVLRGRLTAAAASVATLLMAQAPAQPVKADAIVPETHVSPEEKSGRKQAPISATKDSIRTISGKILDSLIGEPLIGAAIFIKNTPLGVVTRIDGYFSLPLPLDFVEQNEFVLTVSYTGYLTQEIPLPSQVRSENLSLLPIQMEAVDMGYMLGGIVGGIAYVKPTPAQRTRRFFQRLFD